jgi:hypothetical protein
MTSSDTYNLIRTQDTELHFLDHPLLGSRVGEGFPGSHDEGRGESTNGAKEFVRSKGTRMRRGAESDAQDTWQNPTKHTPFSCVVDLNKGQSLHSNSTTLHYAPLTSTKGIKSASSIRALLLSIHSTTRVQDIPSISPHRIIVDT